MMKAILGTLSGLALIAFTYLCITVSLAVHVNSKHAAKILMNADDTITKVNTTLDKINGKGGTLQQATETIVRVKDLITLSQATLYSQQKSIALLDAQVSSTMQHVDLILDATALDENEITKQSVETLSATTESVKSIKPLVDNLTAEAKDLQTTTQAVNAMIPDVQATAKNVNGMTSDGKETTAMAKDWLHGILHPTWPERIKNAMLDVLQHLPIP